MLPVRVERERARPVAAARQRGNHGARACEALRRPRKAHDGVDVADVQVRSGEGEPERLREPLGNHPARLGGAVAVAVGEHGEASGGALGDEHLAFGREGQTARPVEAFGEHVDDKARGHRQDGVGRHGDHVGALRGRGRGEGRRELLGQDAVDLRRRRARADEAGRIAGHGGGRPCRRCAGDRGRRLDDRGAFGGAGGEEQGQQEGDAHGAGREPSVPRAGVRAPRAAKGQGIVAAP